MLFLGVMLGLAGALGRQANAAWSRDVRYALNIGDGDAVTDSLGGAFVATNTGRIDWPRPVLLWVNRDGDVPWGRWIDICPPASAGAPQPGLTVTSEPGSIIIHYLAGWVSDGDTTFDMRVQKVNTDGDLLWGEEGVRIINRSWISLDSTYIVKTVVSDGQGGVILTFYDMDYNQQSARLYATQRIDSDGSRQWGDEGVRMVDIYLSRYGLAGTSVADGNGGLIVGCSGPDSILIQRVDSQGDLLWGDEGIHAPLGKRGYLRNAIADREGGVIFSIESARYEKIEATLYRFSSEGRDVWNNDTGLVIYATPRERVANSSLQLKIINMGTGLFHVYWNNLSIYNLPYEYPKIQSINLDGQIQWEEDGKRVSSGDSIQYHFLGCTTGDESAIYVWTDRRNTNNVDRSIFAQKINANGERQWGDEDVLLWNRSGVTISNIFSDCAGGAIVSMWTGARYLQQINANGEIGMPLRISTDDNPLFPGEVNISVFPNPCNNIIQIGIYSPQILRGRLLLRDMLGRSVSDAHFVNSSTNVYSLNLSPYPSGEYILQLEANGRLYGRALQIIK